MRKILITVVIATSLLLAGFSGSPSNQVATAKAPLFSSSSSPMSFSRPFRLPGLAESRSNSPPFDRAPDLSGTSGLIDIAVTTAEESDPAVASCGGNEYLAVYEYEHDVYGQRITSYGTLIGSPFQISWEDNPSEVAFEPDVACQPSYARYVVVWTYDESGIGTTHEILATGVYSSHQSSGSQLMGATLNITDTVESERNPAVACDRIDGTCLVTFEYGDSGLQDIHGRLIGFSMENPIIYDQYDPPFVIGESSCMETDPSLAYDTHNARYLVAWQCTDTGPEPDPSRIVVATVYGTDQPGSMIDDPGALAVTGSFFVNDQASPSVGFNPLENNCLVAFEYSWSVSDTDVYGQYLDLTGSTITALGNARPFATSILDEYSPAISWSGGAEGATAWAGANQYGLVYTDYSYGTDEYRLVVAAVNGEPQSPYTLSTHVADTVLDTDGFFAHPDISGSRDTGAYLAAWHYFFDSTGGEDDVLGMILSPYACYLPSILKP